MQAVPEGHLMIGSREKENEISKIKDKLRPGEEIRLISTQAKAVKPATFFITSERIMIRNPGLVGDTITSLQWTDVGDFTMNKGAMRASIEFVKSSGGNTVKIKDIRKGDADEMHGLIEEFISNIRQRQASQNTDQATPPAPAQSPLDVLKMKFVNGEITEKEFEKKKKLLE